MVEIDIDGSDDFLKIRETLTRIGIPNKDRTVLTQSCHILHKKGRYFIVSFKELYLLDGLKVKLTEEDKARRNTIAMTLEDWGLCDIVHPPREKLTPILSGRGAFTVIPYREKDDWELKANYTFGKKE